MSVVLHPAGVSAADVVAVARGGARVSLGADARAAMERSAAVVAALVDSDRPTYGVSTGFGSLSLIPIPGARR
jgi:histidine ammonia-lyase